MNYRIRKSFTFEAAHQLETAVTKACHECIHGHSYKVEIVVGARKLGAHDMVLDFAEFGPFKQEVMDQWDHGLLLHEKKRPVYEPLIEAGHLKRGKVHFFEENPTAETFAKALHDRLVVYLDRLRMNTPCERWESSLIVERVRVHETTTGWAEYSSF